MIVKGTYHLGVIVEGLYYPNEEQKMDDKHDINNMQGMDMHDHTMPTSDFEVFTRILNISFAIE